MRIVIALAITCFVCIVPAVAFGQTIDDLISQAEQYESLLESGSARFRITTSQFDSATVIEEITCTFKGESYLSECTHNYKKNDTEIKLIETTIVTPDKYEVLRQSHTESISGRSEIFDPQRHVRYDYYALSYGMTINGITISSCLQGNYLANSQVLSVKLLGTETIDGTECHVVRMEFKDDNMIITAWLSSEHQLKPLQIIENYPQHEDDVRSVMTYQYKPVKGIWCSEKVVARSFRNDTLLTEHIIDFIDFDVNIPVDDEVFAWSLPSGTEAYDYRTNTRVVIQ